MRVGLCCLHARLYVTQLVVGKTRPLLFSPQNIQSAISALPLSV